MSSTTPTMRTADDGPLEVASCVTALSAQFTVVTGPGQIVHRRRLDTFDRRLQAAGLALEHEVLARGERLVLGRRDGSPVVAVPPTDLRWPALADALPSGPVRDVVAPVIGVRALTVTSQERRRSRQLQLRNEDGKTVVRVELDEPASDAEAPARLAVRPLRGYDQEAGRAERLLLGAGLRPVAQDEDLLPGAGTAARTPGVAREAPASVLLAAALSDFLRSMRDNVPGLLDDVDTEFLHDFRVAVRRTRSTLKLGRPALPEVIRQRWEPAFKGLGDLTTPVRDLDVYELELPAMSRWLVKADPADLDPFARHLRTRRRLARGSLVRSLRSAKFRRLVDDWDDELVRLAQISEDAGREHLSAGELADRSISRTYLRVARGGAAIEAGSPAEELHDLRKRCKELRYALEVFAPVVDKVARKKAVADLKGLQDALGRFQDTEVERRALREFAEEMMAAGTTAAALLAMGELIGHLDIEQQEARREFDVAFARLQRPSSRHRMDHLGGRS